MISHPFRTKRSDCFICVTAIALRKQSVLRIRSWIIRPSRINEFRARGYGELKTSTRAAAWCRAVTFEGHRCESAYTTTNDEQTEERIVAFTRMRRPVAADCSYA